ncbi:MAG: hypothetical protein ACT6U0_22715 [Shinella sp.]|uniref:hypothetical protein n=1 Tax=Shinella sp. TaxID=1870904 RepID=UPI0040370233
MQFLLRALLSVSLLFVAPLGAAAEGFPVRDIRKVVVSGDDSVPPTVLKRTGEHLKRSAKATRRAVSIDRAAMDVRVSGVTQSAGGQSSANVTIMLSDLKGSTSLRQVMTVNSFMPGRKGREAALADAIAKRVAIAYHLAPVATGKAANDKRPGKGRKHAGRQRAPSTRQVVQTHSRKDSGPLVIPTEAARTVRSRALSEGSQKKVAPCVVTQAIACD